MDEFESRDKGKLDRHGENKEQRSWSQHAETRTEQDTGPAGAEKINGPRTVKTARTPVKEGSFLSGIAVVPRSLAAAFLVASVTVWPLAKLIAVSYFRCSPKSSSAIASIAALILMYPIAGVLENIHFLRNREINLFKAFFIFAGAFLFVAIISWAFMTPSQDQKDPGKKIGQSSPAFEKQLPLAGHAHEGNTKKYLKAVRDISSRLTLSTDFINAYENYISIYIKPLEALGYEYNITMEGAIGNYLVKDMHARSNDEFELMMFNAVCFRDRLRADGIITDAACKKLSDVAFEWTKPPSGEGKSTHAARLAEYDGKCPIADLKTIYFGSPLKP